MPRPRRWSAPSTVSTRTAPDSAANAVAAGGRPARELPVDAAGADAVAADLRVALHHPAQRRDLRVVLVREERRAPPGHLDQRLVEVPDPRPLGRPEQQVP